MTAQLLLTAVIAIGYHTPQARRLGTGRGGWKSEGDIINVNRVECARMPGAEPDTKWVDRGLIHSTTIYLDIECYRRMAAVCV